jgi:predicted MFS family arabinose efflux permease
VLATIATQSTIVVLSPIVKEVADEFDTSIAAVGQARTVLALCAAIAAFAGSGLIDRLGVRPLIVGGAALAMAGSLASALSPTLALFYVSHALAGLGVAALLSAGFAGVGAWFPESEAAWAMGYVVGSQSISWIVGNPLIGVLTDLGSWRLAYAVPVTFGAAALLVGLTAPKPARSHPGGGIRGVVRDMSARRWALAELVAYAAWTAELTYAGAFYVETYGVSVTTVGVLLAIGSFVFLLATLNTQRVALRLGRRRMIVLASAAMGFLLIPLMNFTPSVAVTLAIFCLMATCAGLRSAGSSALGLSQLPAHPGSMMAARTASAQIGYVVGALLGGVILAVADFGTLGFVLCAGMLIAAMLLSRVSDPTAQVRTAT